MERNNWQPQQSPLIGDRAHALVLSPTDGETAAHLCPTNTCETIHVTLDSIYQTDLQDTNRTTTHTTNRFVLELDLDITNLLDSSRVSAAHYNAMILSSKHWGVTDDSTFRWRIYLTDGDTSPTATTAIATAGHHLYYWLATNAIPLATVAYSAALLAYSLLESLRDSIVGLTTYARQKTIHVGITTHLGGNV